MATIATSVLWGNNPRMYFDFSYEKKRDGSTQYYSITVSCRALQGNSYFGYPVYVKIYLDGVEKTAYTLKGANPAQWSSAIVNTTGWLAVSNKTSGTTAIAIRVYSGAGSTRDTTYNYTLDVDPAASTISCTRTPVNIESNPTITIDALSSNFTHTISYAFGSLKDDIAVNTSATKITSWTIPAEFYAQIPNAKTGECTLTCITYSGGTPIGDPSTCTLYVATDEAKCKPTVSGTVVDTNAATVALTGNNNILVRYQSTALCTLSATLNKSAGSIKTKTINNVAISGNTLEILNVEVSTFDFYAKDSREYYNLDKVVKPAEQFIAYIPLTNDATIYRDEPTSGRATLKIEGNYFDGNFGAKGNTLTVQYRQGDGAYIPVTPTINGNRYSATVSLTGLDYTKAFNFDVIVTDALSTIPKPLTLQKGIPVFDWGEDDFNFNVPVTINGINILEKLAELEQLVKG